MSFVMFGTKLKFQSFDCGELVNCDTIFTTIRASILHLNLVAALEGMPAQSSYQWGNTVRIYIDRDATEQQYHQVVAKVQKSISDINALPMAYPAL